MKNGKHLILALIGFIPAEFKKEKSISNHFESHHAPYVAVPLLQSKLIRATTNMTDKNESNLKEIFNQLDAFKDSEGYYYWAKNKTTLMIILYVAGVLLDINK